MDATGFKPVGALTSPEAARAAATPSEERTLDKPHGGARAAQQFFRMLSRRIVPLIPHLMLGVANQAWWGYGFGVTNQAFQLPLLRRRIDPTLYPNDAMVGAASSGYVTYYYHLIAGLVRLTGSLKGVLFVVNVVALGLLFATTYGLSVASMGSTVSGVVMLALMWSKRFDLQLGGGFLQRRYNMQTFATAPIGIYAVAEFVRGRYRLAFVLLGVLFNLNGLAAVYLGAMCGAAYLLVVHKRGLKACSADVAVFLVCAAPTIFWHLQASAGQAADAAWLAVMRARSASHVFPSTWSATQVYDYALFFTIGALCWSYVRRSRHPRLVDSAFGAFGLVFLCFCAVGYIFAEVWPLRAVLLAQLFRSSSYVTIFLLMYIGHAVCLLCRQRSLPLQIGGGVLLLAALLPEYRDLFLVVGVFLLWTLRSELDTWVALPAAGVIGAFPFVPGSKFTAAGLAPAVKFVGSLFQHRAAAVTWASLAGWAALRRQLNPRWAAGLALVLFSIWYPVVVSSTFHRLDRSPNLDDDWHAVQLWASKHTPRNARFLTPPKWEGFRVHSQRSTVLERKDGTIAFMNAEFGDLWWRRWNRIPRDRAYDRMSEREVRKLARDYGFEYVVMRRARSWSLQEAFRRGKLRVYRVSAPQTPYRR